MWTSVLSVALLLSVQSDWRYYSADNSHLTSEISFGVAARLVQMKLPEPTSVQADTDYFDCRRPGQNCLADGTCKDDGNCKCAVNFSSYNCGLNNTLRGTSPCGSKTDSCGSDGGICYSNQGKKACQCPKEAYGEHCEKKRFEVTCTNDSMLIVMFPVGVFTGVIYVDGQKNTRGCTFSKSNLPADTDGLALNVADADCGGVTSESVNSTKSRTVIIQYDTRYFTSTDTNVTVKCGEGTNLVKVRMDYESEITYRHIQDEDIDNTPDFSSSAVQFNIKLRDGSPVSPAVPVPLDEQLTFEFIPESGNAKCSWKKYRDQFSISPEDNRTTNVTSEQECLDDCDSLPGCVAVQYYLNDIEKHRYPLCIMFKTPQTLKFGRGYIYVQKVCANSSISENTIRVESCTAKNKKTGKDLEMLQIIENSCSSPQIGKLMQQDPTRRNGIITFKLQPFKFNNNTAITVSCAVKVCPEGKERFCDAAACENRSGILVRNSRSVDQRRTTVEKTFNVQE